MPLQDQIIEILKGTLQLKQQITADTLLLGTIPEFDSMAVISIITELEDHFGFTVDDDEIDASVFETLGTLVAFVERKLA